MLRRPQESHSQQAEKASEQPKLMIVHDGKSCPTNWNSFVRVLHRDGQETSDVACEYVWSHQGQDFDILAYRVMGEHVTKH